MNQKNQKGFKKPSRILYVLCLAVFITFNLASLSTANGQTFQKNLTSVYTRVTSNLGGYMVSLPNDYAANPSKKYPLLISLPGIGERGDGSPGVLERVSNVAVAKNIKAGIFPSSFTVGGVSYSFIVVTPMMADASPGNWAEDVNKLIQHLKGKYRVNDQKVYLSGLSLGGTATWMFSAKYGNQLAASLIICSGAVASAANLQTFAGFNLPVWATHNEGDNVLKSVYSKNLVAAINNYTGTPAPPKAKLTIFNKGGHDAWSQTYNVSFKEDGLNVFEWMLSKTRGVSQPAPSPPVVTANAGANKIITLPTNTVTLDASASKVSSGTIASYTWTKVSGPSGGVITPVSNGVQANITGLVKGTYQFQVTVKSSYGNTANAVVTVTVNDATLQPPTAVITGGGTGTITLPANTVYLSGATSKTSTGGAITKWAWSYVSGPGGYKITSPATTTTYINNLVAGTYVFRLTITDASGLTATATKQIVVEPALASLQPPTAVITGGGTGTITLPANTIYLSGATSKTSTGGAITKWAWSYVSGPGGYKITSPATTTTYINNLVAGTYVFRLTITDASGLTSTATKQIVVNQAVAAKPSPKPPTAIITGGGTGTLILPDNRIYLSSATSKASTGGAITKWAWSRVSGPGSYTIATPTYYTTYITNLVAGTYVFKLTLTDASGLTSSTTKQIVVKSAVSSRTTANEVAATNTPANEAINSDVLNADADLNFKISPNPVHSDMNIALSGAPKGKVSIVVYDINGKSILQQEFVKDGNGTINKSVNLSKLPSGIYIVQAIVDGKYKKVLRVVKQ